MRSIPPHPSDLEAALTRDQRDCDLLSFFVDGKLFQELSGHEVARHDCLHLINVVAKLSRTEADLFPEDLKRIEAEVTPDLLVYAVQIASALRVQWTGALMDSIQIPSAVASHPSTINDLQKLFEYEGSANLAEVIVSVRKIVTEATSSLARRCDKRDHMEASPGIDALKDIVLPLIVSSMRLANILNIDMESAYRKRIEEIKEKYGDVRVLLGALSPRDDAEVNWTNDPDKEPHAVDTHRTLLRSQREKPEPYRISVGQDDFVVFPNVFPPSYYNDTEFFADQLPIESGDEFLEIGSGTGVISIVAAKKGASRVLALDINRDAVVNTRVNALMHGCDDITEARWSDVYSELSGSDKFDKIFWNVPFGLVNHDLTMLEKSVFDKGYASIQRFIAEAKHHLKPGGKVYVGFSSVMGRRDILDDFIVKAGFQSREIAVKTQTEGRAQPLTFEIIELTS